MKTTNSFRSKFFALVLALVASVSSYAKDGYPDFQVDGLYYNFLEGDSVQVTFLRTPPIPTEVAADTSNKKYAPAATTGAEYGHLTEIVIPSTVTYEEKTYHVIRIGHGSFLKCVNLQHVDLPTSIKSIGVAAFWSCHSLSSITLNEGLESIEEHALWDCPTLKEVTLPSTLKSLGQKVFGESISLSKVICKAAVPPVVENDLLTGTDNYNASIIPNATLYVPASSLTTYQNTYPWNTFGQILSIEDSLQNIFPTLAGLQRTHTIEMYDHAPNDGKRSGGYPLPFASVKDTVINGKTYLQFGDYVNGSNYSLFFLREENNKVLIYSSILQNDLVLYDYTLELGDSLPAITSDHDYFSDDHFTKLDKAENIFTYVVTDVSTVTLLDGIERKKWILKNKYLPIIEYVEGIGCYGENTSHSGDFFRLIHDHPYTTEYVGDHLVCISQNGQLLYSMTQEEMNSFTLTCECLSQEDTIDPKDLFPTLTGLQRTSCTKTIGEDEYGTVWGSRSYLMQETQTTTIDGKQYIVFGDEYDRFALREENNKILVYSSILKKDLVLYDFTLEVGDSLPALYYELRAHNAMQQWLYNGDIVDYNKNDDGTILPAETFVVTDISTITLLDGKEYKKWTFDNGMEYVEGIGSFGTSYAWNDFYQLIANGPLYSDVFSQHLVCVSKNGQLLYQMDKAEMERLGAECLCEVETSYKSQWCNKWNVMWFDGMRFDETARTSKYRLGKDTVIGDYTYSKFISGTYVRFTDDRKVYVYHEYFDDHDPYSEDLPTGEYLAYDFSAQVGDTLEVFSGVGTYSTYPCVVDDVQIDSETNLRTMTLHKICRIDEEDYDDSEMTWIEGVGSPEGFLISYLPCGWVGGGTYALLCAYQGDELKYTGSLYERFGCDYKAGVVSDDLFPTLSGLQRTICREYCEQADNKTRIEQFTNLTTRTETGGPYLYYSPFLLREKDNKILIYSRTLNKDLVLYDFNLQVGDSLPMLYIDFFAKDDWIADRDMEIWCVVDYHKDLEGNILPADTLIVTDVSMITLLDGKEYKKWTFNNGMEYVEGIGSFGNGQWSGDLFQLIANKDVPTCLLDEHLVCASKNGQLLYQMDDTEMEQLETECLCEYNDGPKKDNAKDGKIGGRPTPTQWNMLEMVVREMENNKTILLAETFSYTLEDNSRILNNKTYFDLARQSTRDTAITKSVVGALHFSEDEGNRVYFLCDGVEYILYDFTAEPGDSIEIFAGINNYPQATTYTHVVTSKDTLENGACRMVLEVVFPNQTDGTNLQKVWLAGLGSLDGIVHNSAQLASNARSAETESSVMLCAWREDDCLYTTDHPEFDKVGCVYNLPTAVDDIQTPETQYQKIIHNGHLYILRNNKIYDVLGTPLN